MNQLVILLPVALGLGALGLCAFVWSLKRDQYEDLDGAAWRILGDEDIPDTGRVSSSEASIKRKSGGGNQPSL